MYVITLKDHPQGIYSVFDKDEERVVPLFLDEDDAVRYVMALACLLYTSPSPRD